MATIDFRQYVRTFQNWGVVDVVLPFLLIFVLLFAVLQKTKVLGNRKLKEELDAEQDKKKKAAIYARYTGKRFNVVIALVFALLVVIPHVVYQGTPHDGKLSIGVAGSMFPDAVDIINNSLPTISVWVIAILMVLLLLGLFGARMEILGYPLTTVIAIAAFAIVVYVFGAAANFWDIPSFLRRYDLDSPSNLFALLLIFAFAVALYFIVKEPEEAPEEADAQGNYPEGTWARALQDLWKPRPPRP